MKLMKMCRLVYLALKRKRRDELGSDFIVAEKEIGEDLGELCGDIWQDEIRGEPVNR